MKNNLGDEIRKFGRIGHAVPSEKRENAGLVYPYKGDYMLHAANHFNLDRR